MRSATIDRAREFAEAMLDACEIAEETRSPVGVIYDEDRGIAYAVKRFVPDDVCMTIFPNDSRGDAPTLRVVGT